jgi:hypothetical protein
MRFTVGMSFAIDRTIDAPEGEEAMMDDGELQNIRSLAADYREKVRQKVKQDDLLLEHRNMIKTQGQNRWNDLREKISEAVQALNSEYGGKAINWESVRADQILLTRIQGSIKLEGGFDDSTYTVFFRCPPAEIEVKYELAVEGGRVEFTHLNPSTHVPSVYPIEGIAYMLLQELLRC